ncbi:MAG TPA: TetR/AcrR family transcriptional regulator [Solirubrobacteraceae bacterium]|nr:TetR/AcrR family transcriptional regulator [Solirubrobacteraceae bacterium]
MEAASKPRDLAGEKAQRIVDAMRSSVAQRGAAGSTFDHVAREAGVSRGLLHYYFGTKERLLVEVVRRDTEIRMEMLDAALVDAHTADDFIQALVSSLEDLVEHQPEFITLWFELFTVARRNEEIGAEVAALTRRTRAHVAELLEAKQDEGVIRLHDEPEAVVAILFALADGIAMRMLIEPEHDWADTLRAGTACARALLTD